ncbi:hypothetical protein AB1N83_014216, partial [Pleurotus pulmonarius]
LPSSLASSLSNLETMPSMLACPRSSRLPSGMNMVPSHSMHWRPMDAASSPVA